MPCLYVCHRENLLRAIQLHANAVVFVPSVRVHELRYPFSAMSHAVWSRS